MPEDYNKTQLVYMPGYTLNQLRALHACQLSASILSVIFGTTGLTLWLRMDKTRRMVFRLQVFLFIISADYLKALCYFLFNSIRLANIKELRDPSYVPQYSFCDGWGFMITLTTFYSDSLIFCLTIHNAIMIFLPQGTRIYRRKVISYINVALNIGDMFLLRRSPFKHSMKLRGGEPTMIISEGGLFRFRHELSALIGISGIIFCSLIFVDGGHFQIIYSCAAPQLPVWKRLLNSWILRFTNILTIVVVYTAIIIFLYLKFQQINKEKAIIYRDTTPSEGKGPEDPRHRSVITGTLQRELMEMANNEMEKRMQRAMIELRTFMVYPLCYLVVWAAPTASQIYFYIDPIDPPQPFALRLLVALSLPISCTMFTTIFLVREKPWRGTAKRLKKAGKYRSNYPPGVMSENEFPDEMYDRSTTRTCNARNDAPLEDESRSGAGDTLTDFEMEKKRRQSSNGSQLNKASTLRSFMTGLGSRRYSPTAMGTTNEEASRDEERNLNNENEEGEEEEYDFLEFLRRGPE